MLAGLIGGSLNNFQNSFFFVVVNNVSFVFVVVVVIVNFVVIVAVVISAFVVVVDFAVADDVVAHVAFQIGKSF